MESEESEHAGASKPHRDIFLLACKNAGCRSEGCVYVGDRLDVDARGSRAAGMRGIWLDRGQSAAAADVETIHSLADLKARLLS